MADGGDINAAIATMCAGDTLSLATNGHYTITTGQYGFLGVPSGRQGQPTIIQGKGATITGGRDGLNFYGKSYIDIDSLHFVDQERYCNTYDYCDHINQSGCTYESNGAGCLDVLKILRSNDLKFTSCHVLPSASSLTTMDGFEFWGPCNRVVCQDCSASGLHNGAGDNEGHGFEVYGENAGEICNDIKFINCETIDCRIGFTSEGGAGLDALHTNVVAVNCNAHDNLNYDYGGLQGATIYRRNSTGTTTGNVVDL